MKGCQIKYILRPGCSSRFNQKMFGRISIRHEGEKTYAYYLPGILDNIPHYRIFRGRIFLGTAFRPDVTPVKKFCSVLQIATADKDDGDIFLKTGRDKWRFHAREACMEVERL